MDINNEKPYTSVDNTIYGEYRFEDSSLKNVTPSSVNKATLSNHLPNSIETTIKQAYSVPLDFVRKEAASAHTLVSDTIFDIENLMKKVFINPNISNDLLYSHQMLWEELHKNLYSVGPEAIKVYNERVAEAEKIRDLDTEQITSLDISESMLGDNDELVTIQPYPGPSQLSDSSKNKKDDKDDLIKIRIPIPSYICFDEVLFAEKLNSTSARSFLEEFYHAIAHSTFSYFLQFRKFLKSLEKEILYIQSSLNQDFQEDYENELQQKVAAHYDAWSKTIKHYSSRIAKTIISKPGAIPSAELDKITKEHAAKFQAFFAIKLNSVDSEIEDIIQSLKRDLEDNSIIFYNRYLSPGLKFSSEIGAPFELDYETTSLKKDLPFLSEELLIASLVLKGNFTSIMADIIDRHHILMGKADTVMRLIHEKRKYANYISQLAVRGIQKPSVLMNIDDDVYSQIFNGAAISQTRKDTPKSAHSLLSGLDDDDHPQYLLRDGGKIVGNIYVAEGITIDGVDLSAHAHTGSDGSAKIKSTDIDYDSVRSTAEAQDIVQTPISVNVAQFNVDIVNGVPRCDAVVNIEVSDDNLEKYEYEIIYTEVT